MEFVAVYQDAKSLRSLLMATLRDYRAGNISTNEATIVIKFAGRILEAMRVEALTCPTLPGEVQRRL